MANGKLGGGTKLFLKIAVPVAVFLLALLTVATILMNTFSTFMNQNLGYGELIVEQAEDTAGLDGKYYDFTYKKGDTTGAKTNGAAVNAEIVSEGATLLKNEGNALPLAKNSGVTLFGYKTVDMNMSGGESIHSEKFTASRKNFVFSLEEGLAMQGFQVNPTTVDLYMGALEIRNTKPATVHTGTGSTFADEIPASYYNTVYKGNISENNGTQVYGNRNYSYTSIEQSYADYNDAAIVTIKRNSGEGNDQTKVVTGDNNRTGLSLSSAELDLLEYICGRSEFSKVVVLINSANAMEMGFLKDGATYTDKYTGKTYDFSKIKAGFWVGGIGSNGVHGIADLLDGTVNPSGSLPDTYVRDHTKDPTFVNFGDFRYDNISSTNSYKEGYFVEYEEGIYVGYRYYETAAYLASKGSYTFDYNNAVTYPFGYGMSYSSFTMAYDETPAYDENTNEFTFKVKVTNNDTSRAGKKTVMIFCNQPYISGGGVEKSHVVLAGFGKTSLLGAGKSEVVTITIDRDYITSYDYKNEKCYILDKGDYNFYLSDDSHSWASISATDSAKVWKYTLDDKIVYDKNNPRKSDESPAVNKFDEDTNWKFKEYNNNTAGSGYATNMTRENFTASFPSAPVWTSTVTEGTTEKKVGGDYTAQEKVLSDFRVYTTAMASEYPEVTQAPKSEVNPGTIKFSDMRGKDYDDPVWQTFIEQFSIQSLYDMYRNGGWQIAGDEINGVPKTVDMDGPYGFFAFSYGTLDNIRWYQSEPVLAATFNIELAKKMGDAIAEEGHAQGAQNVTGWYGPGANTHRSGFGGRNYEYYSEDGLLGGKMLAAEVEGASQKGLICYTKHAALNDQEQHRQDNGLATWANEQAIREIYFKPWEIFAKEAKMDVKYYEKVNGEWEMKTKTMTAANGMMTAYNRIGAVWAGESEAFIDVFRSEYGFIGISLTDAGGSAGTYMNPNSGLLSGATDLLLTSSSSIFDPFSDTPATRLQEAGHRLLYHKVNSNAMQPEFDGTKIDESLVLYPGSSVSYGIAPWQVLLIVGWVVVGVLTVGAAVVAFLMIRKDKSAA